MVTKNTYAFFMNPLLISIAGVFSSSLFANTNPEKPNFILIVADDLGFADLSLNGSKQIRTPNIDKLAYEGVNFTHGYVTSPVCSPSRAGLITGRNQVHFGFDNNIAVNQPGFDPEFLGLPVSEKTIADRLPVLFNLIDDVSEQNDLATEYPERTRRMLKELGEWDVSLPHPLFLEGAVWKKRQLDLYDVEYQLVQPD